MSHIPIAFFLLGVIAALYALVNSFSVKTKNSRRRRPGSRPKANSMS
jgi:hypothetical protein